MKVLITVPHAFCLSDNIEVGVHDVSRHCDAVAGYFASKIDQYLKKERVDTTLMVSQTLRAIYDMNRRESRETAFRKNLETEFVSGMGCEDILIDVHSAPHDTVREYGVDDDFEIYLLTFKESLEFSNKLIAYLKSRDVKVYWFEGSIKDDIVWQSMHDFGFMNVSLLEINESLKKKRIDEISMLIAWFIVTR